MIQRQKLSIQDQVKNGLSYQKLVVKVEAQLQPYFHMRMS